MLLIASKNITIPQGTERYYLAFQVRTDFGVIDIDWDLAVRNVIRWKLADGSSILEKGIRVIHSLRSWRPFLIDLIVPDGAEMLQIGFEIGGILPNSSAVSTIWLDEVRLFAEPSSLSPIEVVGTTTDDGLGGLSFTGSSPGNGDGFRIEASFMPSVKSKADEGEVKGKVINLTGKDVPVDLIFAVDVDAEGGRIDHDISRGDVIAGGKQILDDPYPADFYSNLTMSAVPLSSVTTVAGNTLGLAIALDIPSIFLFRYNGELKQFEILYRFGLKSSGSHDSASFDHHILRTDSKWSYRDLWRRFIDEIEADRFSVIRSSIRPIGAQFVSVFDINDPNLSSLVPDLNGLIKDFGLSSMQNSLVAPLPDILFERLEEFDLEMLNYDFPWILETSTNEGEQEPPSYDDIEDKVSEIATQDGINTFSRLQSTIAKQVLRDTRGDLLVNRVFSPNFAFGDWLIRIPVQNRPGLSPYFDMIMDEKYIPAFTEGDSTSITTRTRINSLVFDSFMKESKVLDWRDAEASNAPLTYDPNDGSLCSHLSDANVEYLKAIRDQLDTSGFSNKLMVGNLNELGPSIFGMPILDSGVWEATPLVGANFGHSESNARRMMFSKKKVGVIDKTDWCDLPDSHIRSYADTIALLGLYPNLFNFLTPPECLLDMDRQMAVRAIMKEIVPVLDAMNDGGWQVITHAKITNADGNDELTEELRVERFGITPPIHFSVLNNPSGILGDDNAIDQNVLLTVDIDALGFTETPTVSVAYGQIDTPKVNVDGRDLELVFSLEAGQGAIVRIDEVSPIMTPIPTIAPTPTPTITPSILTSLTVDPETTGKSRKLQTATVVTLDQNNQQLSGLIVKASTKGRGVTVKPTSATTGPNGAAKFNFKFGRISKGGEIIFTANGLSATIKQR